MLYLGIDDTDIIGSPGTNQLARAIVKRLGATADASVICRHQLFFDRRVPYTSKNGSASIVLPRAADSELHRVLDDTRDVMRAWFVQGSDPGLCITSSVPDALHAWGRRCQQEVVTQDDARATAAAAGVHLEALGGTEQGIIGALAAVGLAATGEDGRVVQLFAWPYPDEFSGPQDAAAIYARGIDEIRDRGTNAIISRGTIDIGTHLRPNVRHHRIVLFVDPTPTPAIFRAIKLT